MQSHLAWVILGFALILVELVSATFYLLVLGIAAFGAAVAAWLGHDFPLQAIVWGVIAAFGCYGVHIYRAKNMKEQMTPIDAGQPASFENWLDQGARLARVRYRGASWDARVEGEAVPESGAMLYVVSTSGNTLTVTTRRPA